MPDAEQTNARPPLPSRMRPLWAVLAAVVAVGAVYGMLRGGGKESGQSNACAASASTAQRLGPLAKGEVAALNIAKSPKPAVEIAFDGPDGARRQLSEFKGKTVLFNLWATWCVPCREEMPALDRLQTQLGSDKFEVVAVNIDTARLDRRKAFLDSVGVKSLAFYTDAKAETFQTLRQAGKVTGLPTTILIDAAGCELGIMAGPAVWDGGDALALLRAALDNVPSARPAPPN